MTSALELGELLLRVSKRLHHHYRSLSIAPHQGRALRIIGRGPIRPARLAEKLQITPRAVTDVADILVKEHLITVEPDPADRRAKVLTITERGAARLATLRTERRQAAATLFKGLNEAEREQLTILLRKVADHDHQRDA